MKKNGKDLCCFGKIFFGGGIETKIKGIKEVYGDTYLQISHLFIHTRDRNVLNSALLQVWW